MKRRDARYWLSRAGFLLLLGLALFGAWRLCYLALWNGARARVEAVEAGRDYDPELLYLRGGGEPLLLARPENRVTLVFLEGFRTQKPAGMYRAWLEELHARGANVLVPVYGIQSSPFAYRNRDWRKEEDLRLALQVYEAFTALLPEGHRVVLCAQSFGALPALGIAARAARRPDALVLLSPLNARMDFRASGPLVRWLSSQTSWLRRVLPFSFASAPPGRASIWDIADPARNLAVAEEGAANPEDSAELGFRSERAAAWLEAALVPRVAGYPIDLVYGGEDLYFAQEGFTGLGAALERSGNVVRLTRLEGSGHMVLLDLKEAEARARVEEALFGRAAP